jgi:basic membrane lipoprotein Med (substrate-binding protein (PBP1-ABC) superfamily)
MAACTPPQPDPSPLPSPVVIGPTVTVLAPSESAAVATPTPALIVSVVGPLPAALEAAADELGYRTQIVADASAGIGAGAGVIVITDPGQTQNAVETARANPDQHFIIAGAGSEAPPNAVLITAERYDQAGFMAGAIAAHATEVDRVGVVSGGTDPMVLAYRNGFINGVRYLCPRCQIDTFDLPDLNDPTLASTQGQTFAVSGPDVFFVGPGPGQPAMLQALAEAGVLVMGSGDILHLAFDGGARAGADRALAGVYVDSGLIIAAAFRDYASGSARSGPQPVSIATGGVVVTPLQGSGAARVTGLDQVDIDAAALALGENRLDTGVDLLTGQPR